MSYGRSPYLIIGTKGWHGDVIQFMEPQGSISRDVFPYPPSDREGRGQVINVPREAIAQLILNIASRGTEVLQEWINEGIALNRDYTNFQKTHPDEWIRHEYEEHEKFLASIKVTVEIGYEPEDQ